MKKLIAIILFCIGMTFMPSCSHKVGQTDMIVQDSLRHYKPVLQGQQVEILYRVANIGKEPLVITDIHPSCGCISYNNADKVVILPEKEITLRFIFDSSKYMGFVEHNIYLYGNMKPNNIGILKFDIEIVPPYGSSPDYEEWYYENKKTEYIIKGFVEGYENQREYYINSGDYPEDYERHYKRYSWREK